MTLTAYHLERDTADRLLVLLHGWSAEQHHLAAYVPLVDPDERFTAVCPRAIHDLPEGDGASWYDRDGATPDAGSYVGAVDTLEAFVVEQMERTGIPAERTVLGGFSQGGFLALTLALRSGAPRYAGVWAMCCGIHDIDAVTLATDGGDDRPALVQYGELDTIIPPERTKEAVATLESAGWDVAAHGYQMAHDQRIEMMVDARAWLAAID